MRLQGSGQVFQDQRWRDLTTGVSADFSGSSEVDLYILRRQTPANPQSSSLSVTVLEASFLTMVVFKALHAKHQHK